MRSVTYSMGVSLDGYIVGPDGKFDWADPDEELFRFATDEVRGLAVHLMGRRLYEAMLYWETAEQDPSVNDLEREFAAIWKALPKVVFSSTLQPPLSWSNTQLVSDDAVDAVREMKKNGTSPLRTLGSLALCRSLLTAGLVDRFRVVVFPVVTGSTGRERIYDGYPDVAMTMVGNQTFDGRLQLLEYVPTVLTGPPGVHAVS